jgi:Oxidoreductase molybdopterin binding domain
MSHVHVRLLLPGNRRKEQNMVRKSKGFNWGPAATGCSMWTGVRMADLLRCAGVDFPADPTLHVCFRWLDCHLCALWGQKNVVVRLVGFFLGGGGDIADSVSKTTRHR